MNHGLSDTPLKGQYLVEFYGPAQHYFKLLSNTDLRSFDVLLELYNVISPYIFIACGAKEHRQCASLFRVSDRTVA